MRQITTAAKETNSIWVLFLLAYPASTNCISFAGEKQIEL